MPRYHYSRVTPHSATTSSESFFQRQNFNGPSSKPIVTTTTSNNNNTSNNQFSSGLFKSTFTPIITHSRTMMPNKREFIQIPVTREDGVSITNSSIHSVPVTFISETTQISSNVNDSTRNASPKPHYTNLLRPGSKYSQNHSNTSIEESETNIPRLPSVSRRFNLTVPVLTTTTTTNATAATPTPTTDDDNEDTTKQNRPLSSVRRIPTRFAQTTNVASIPTNSARISSAILRSSPLSNPLNNQLQRQKTDLADSSSSLDVTGTGSNTSSVRRAEAMAREAIQGVVRFQQQQHQQQQSNNLLPDNNNSILIRSPALSRRVIVNLKNNQSVSLDSRLLSAHTTSTKSLSNTSSSRMSQRNNLYHIPVLHEIQVPSHPISIVADNLLHSSQSSSIGNSNNNNYKNEFRMEIPVSIITKEDLENRVQLNHGREDEGIINYDQQSAILTERIPSASVTSNQTLKSILKRSSSRETVSRKNVSFMNA